MLYASQKAQSDSLLHEWLPALPVCIPSLQEVVPAPNTTKVCWLSKPPVRLKPRLRLNLSLRASEASEPESQREAESSTPPPHLMSFLRSRPWSSLNSHQVSSHWKPVAILQAATSTTLDESTHHLTSCVMLRSVPFLRTWGVLSHRLAAGHDSPHSSASHIKSASGSARLQLC